MSDQNKPVVNEPEDEQPEVEAHAEEVLGLQGIDTLSSGVTGGGDQGFGSCSSCVGSFCM